ncbi:EF-hand domain-containing protein [Methylomarinum vadi]|uniref:hypothetical protein n=1 Tax=Methylomarinum vadi TaxID=438855 RepID=UPI0012689A9A|nr:hypothetical protein [Methylomarinum vadi]
MKILTSSLISGLMIIASPMVLAESYEEDKVKDMVLEMDDDFDKKVNFKEYYEETVTDNVSSYDVNRDGYITEDEIEHELTEELMETVNEMNRLGVGDHDEDVTVTNALMSMDKKAKDIVKMMDTDHDNLVENDEIEEFRHKQFDALDKNKDGFLSEADTGKRSKQKGWPIRLR